MPTSMSRYVSIFILNRFRKFHLPILFIISVLLMYCYYGYLIHRIQEPIYQNWEKREKQEINTNENVLDVPPVVARGRSRIIVKPKQTSTHAQKITWTNVLKNYESVDDRILKQWRMLYDNQMELIFSCIGRNFSKPDTFEGKNELCNKKSQTFEDFLDLELYQLGLLENQRKIFENKNISRVVSDYVQHVFYWNQNNQNCDNTNALLCHVSKGCGFGCQMHHLIHCFNTALARGKILIVDGENWHNFKSLYDIILPFSVTCDDKKIDRSKIETIPIIDFHSSEKFTPTAVPDNIIHLIEKFHTNPFVWWVGQLIKFIFRFQNNIDEFLNKTKTFHNPIVGIHIRRTDKIGLEAEKFDEEEYMYWADLYFRKLALKGIKFQKAVYIATDEVGLVDKIRKKFPNYKIYSNDNFTKSANDERSAQSGTLGVLADIYLLSNTDYIVCTFSSQVCRLAYEWMNNRHIDASYRYKSLDEIYYFGGQQQREFHLTVDHKSKDNIHINSHKFNLRHNDWNGYSMIQLLDSSSSYHVPSYKIKETWLRAPFEVFKKYENSLKK